MLLSAAAITVQAVPAYPGWMTRTQADGSTIEVQLVGDEFYSFMVNREGKEVMLNEVTGMYEVKGEAPQPELVKARRTASMERWQRRGIGTAPNLAPRGVVIIVNFKDEAMQPTSTLEKFDELFNSENCTVNQLYGVNFGSAAQYFADQSNGAYRPIFDVFGPYTLSRNMEYYGHDISNTDRDEHAADAVAEACIGLNSQIDFTQYDSDNDGKVDFVYVVYAGEGQASGGPANTIWPHNWSLDAARYYGKCTYTASQCNLDGKQISNYAMSGELMWNDFAGIGTLCHEFGHVMGLPDLYDTQYSTNYKKALTPNDWDVMDLGSYNGNGHCPPNYDPWEKYFFGWLKPVNYGSNPHLLTLNANGTENYNVLQITSANGLQDYDYSNWAYYIENRQRQGWDTYLGAHGMLVWKVKFDASKWTSNAPNNTANSPYFTVVSAVGTKIGTHVNEAGTAYEYDAPNNPFPGNGNVTSWTGITGKPVYDIKEKNGIITATYIAVPPIEVMWVVNDELIEIQEYNADGSEDLRLPEAEVIPCDGTTFIGWTKEEHWADPFVSPDDLFAEPSGKVTEEVYYYALFE